MFDIFQNTIAKRRMQENMPSPEEITILQNIASYTGKKHQINPEWHEQIRNISSGFDEVIEWNNKYEDTVDEIDIDDYIIDLYTKAKLNLGFVSSGKSKSAYKKELIHTSIYSDTMVHPKGSYRDAELSCFFPEDFNKKLPSTGGWVCVIMDIPTKPSPEKYCIFYALPHSKECRAYGEDLKRWTAKVYYENAEIHLHPHEYLIIENTDELLNSIGKDVDMIEIAGTAKLDRNKVFYLKAKGFSQEFIYRMLFKSIKSQAFCYFRLKPHAIEFLEICQRTGSVNMAKAIQNHKPERVKL